MCDTETGLHERRRMPPADERRAVRLCGAPHPAGVRAAISTRNNPAIHAFFHIPTSVFSRGTVYPIAYIKWHSRKSFCNRPPNGLAAKHSFNKGSGACHRYVLQPVALRHAVWRSGAGCHAGGAASILCTRYPCVVHSGAYKYPHRFPRPPRPASAPPNTAI